MSIPISLLSLSSFLLPRFLPSLPPSFSSLLPSLPFFLPSLFLFFLDHSLVDFRSRPCKLKYLSKPDR